MPFLLNGDTFFCIVKDSPVASKGKAAPAHGQKAGLCGKIPACAGMTWGEAGMTRAEPE